MTNTTEKYSPEQVLEIFKEQHRLCSSLDPEADPWAEIKAEMTIREWRWARDLLGWKELSEFLNKEFRIEIPENVWYDKLEPAKKRKLIEVCTLIANHAKKDNYQPKKLFGQPCLKASVFLTIKKNLENKGINVSELRPSSSLTEYMDKYFSPVLEEITLTGTKPIDKIEILRIRKKGFWKIFNFLDWENSELLIGDIKTFRDLVEKIIIEKEKNKA
ncbi:hypothetical protein [Flavobacterium sp. N3904]|uniref:hypothetical protein n=1 Tax=Flavobacterium sp. N3904 TaxID=2986835 RepID=UPI0022240F16|nr:hypothetical protein [Flavobacterium sp. N3904]